MVRPAHGIDGRHSEAVGGEWKQVVHLEHGGIRLCLEDGALVPGTIFLNFFFSGFLVFLF